MDYTKYVEVSQLTAYQKRRLNRDRHCCICGKYIFDYDLLSFRTRRHQHTVEYAFAHYKCFKHIEPAEIFNYYERRKLDGKKSRLFE